MNKTFTPHPAIIKGLLDDSVMQKEEWRDVIGYEGSYRVSDLGRVKSLTRIINGVHGVRSRIKNGRILVLCKDVNGYSIVNLHLDGQRTMQRVHKLVLSAFDRCRPEGLECNHIDGVKTNNNLNNLEWVTRSENALHACRVLGKGVGELNAMSVLTEKQVTGIREKYKTGKFTQTDLGRIYSVSSKLIWQIVNRVNWRHIP